MTEDTPLPFDLPAVSRKKVTADFAGGSISSDGGLVLLRGAERLTAALVDIFCHSFPIPPTAITLDIDDTCDRVHGHQQLSLFNAHYDTRCFLPVHVYHVESGRPVAALLRPGKTPSGAEVRILIKHLVGRIRRHWPRTRLTFRGDSHYGRREAMAWCEDNGVDYIFGLAGELAAQNYR